MLLHTRVSWANKRTVAREWKSVRQHEGVGEDGDEKRGCGRRGDSQDSKKAYTCLFMGACSEITFVLILDRPVPCGEFNLIEGGDYWNFT